MPRIPLAAQEGAGEVSSASAFLRDAAGKCEVAAASKRRSGRELLE
jgi:hypothetical protein